jgi:hypothetical protein
MNLMKKIYVVLFAILYLAVAAVSTIHAIDFFGLANNSWMSVILAISFELGQAAVLFSLLTSGKERTKVMPWVLMGIFTLVQVLGNVYSSYKHIIMNSPENLRFFKEPIFIWTQLPDDQATVIVTYIVCAILPICALLLTSMVTNQFENPNDSIIHLEDTEQETKQYIENESKIDNKQQQISKEEVIEKNITTPIEEQIKDDSVKETIETKENEQILSESNEDIDNIFSGKIIDQLPNKTQNKSHFINLK